MRTNRAPDGARRTVTPHGACRTGVSRWGAARRGWPRCGRTRRAPAGSVGVGGRRRRGRPRVPYDGTEAAGQLQLPTRRDQTVAARDDRRRGAPHIVQPRRGVEPADGLRGLNDRRWVVAACLLDEHRRDLVATAGVLEHGSGYPAAHDRWGEPQRGRHRRHQWVVATSASVKRALVAHNTSPATLSGWRRAASRAIGPPIE